MKTENLNSKSPTPPTISLGRWIATTAITVLTTTSAQALVATENCQVRELGFVPYVSSYLPKAQGPLTHLQGDPKSLQDLSTPATPAQLDLYTHTSLMQRVDLLNQVYLGKETHRQDEVSRSHYKRNAPGWAGFCDVWSAAASSPELNRFLQTVGDVRCGNVVITKGEVRELLTGFSQNKDDGIFGMASLTERSPETHTYRNRSGYDDLSASVFDDKLTFQLGRNRALIMDLDPGPEVWNHPIFHSRRCEQNLSQISGFAANELNVPSRLLVATDPSIALFLQTIEQADAVAQKLDFKQAAALLKRALTHPEFNPQMTATGAGVFAGADYSQLRDQAAQAIEILRDQGKIQLNPQNSYQLVSNTIRYRIEAPFSLGSVNDKEFDLTRQKTLTYVLVKNQSGQGVDQFWITPAAQRPDSIWLPAATGSARDQSEVLKDFVDAVEKCKGISLH